MIGSQRLWPVVVLATGCFWGGAAGAGAGPEPSACSGAPSTAELLSAQLADSGRVYRATLSPDGRVLYFFKKVTADPEAEDYRIFSSRRTPAGWTPAERVHLGGDFSDLYPTLSSDGRRLVFTSYRPFPGDTSSHQSASLWYADRDGDGWDPPAPIITATEPGHYHSQPSYGPGDSLIFRRTTPDWRTSRTLVTRWVAGGFAAPVPYSPVDRWRDWRKDLHVWGGVPGRDGGSVLLEISALEPGGERRGPPDLWVSLRGPGGWAEPRPLGGGVNAKESGENFPAVSPDGCELLFVRDFSAVYHVALREALPRP